MKNSRWILLFVFFTLTGIHELSGQGTYTNPVIPGDHSDCTLTRIGKDFYTTGSSFNPTPVIYHSTDLVHWEAIAQPVSAAWISYGDSPQGGCWGGQMVYYNNKYWHFFSHGWSMYFTTSDQPEGPWSDPEKMNNPSTLPYSLGYDNSVFIDDDGKWYLVVKNGQPNNGIVELGPDGQPTGMVYNLDWLNPESEGFPYRWAEGPVMWKYDGYYYYSFGLDVAGGQKYMRSATLTDDKSAWSEPADFFNENDPDRFSAIFSGPNHSSAAVSLDDGTHWVVHPVWARANNGEWYGQGRQGLLNQVVYDAEGRPVADYPSNHSFTAPKLPSGGIPWMVPKSDFFDDSKLNPEWSYLGYTPADRLSLTERPGWVRLRPKSVSKPMTIIKTDPEHSYALITRLEFHPGETGDEAGLRIMNGMENLAAKIYSSLNESGNKSVFFSYGSSKFEIENSFGDTLWLKLVRDNHYLTAWAGSDGKVWTQVGEEKSLTVLDSYSEEYNGWCGNRQGLYVAGKKDAWFDLYIYRDAYTTIGAENPANQFGTNRNWIGGREYALDNIHVGDWALYAGVEFGNKDYPGSAVSVEFTASATSGNGWVEVWLDSLDTGTKIAECRIPVTGSYGTYRTTSTETIETTGRHDVYLKFTGTGDNRLFMLKNFVFKSPKDHTGIADREAVTMTCVYPNPTGDFFVIESGFKIHSIRIYDLSGRLRSEKNYDMGINEVSCTPGLESGIYILEIRGEGYSEKSRIILK